jgi:flagellar motility protein MotE (MotC chaperone)
VLDGNTLVVVPEEEQAIMNATVFAMKLMEIANFLNGWERNFVKERSDIEKKLKKRDEDLRKALVDLQEMEVNFEAYKDKYQLQLDLTKTLEEKEKEVDRLAEENKVLEEKVAELENLTIPGEEEKAEDPSGEFTQMSRGALIKRCVEAESSAVEMATFSFHNVVAKC